jgi:uncharacterized membrane protein
MPSIDVVDQITIHAPAELVYKVIINYNSIDQWFPMMHCKVLDGRTIKEGSKVKHTFGYGLMKMSSSTRRIDTLTPYTSIEESYIEGDLIGTGAWYFNEHNGKTTVGFHCKVKSNTPMSHLSLGIAGTYGHSMVYEQLLKALKKHCEAKADN